jgi:protein-tyrosine phosphatase
VRDEKRSQLGLLLDWVTRRGPLTILLRIYSQIARIIMGRPIYRYSRITPQIYIGGQYRAHGWPSMEEAGITAVLNLRKEYDDLAKGIAPERYLYLPTTDNTAPSQEQLQEGVKFISDEIANGGTVYIHCGVGVGRAPTMAAAYLVSTGMTPLEAWKTIKQVRPFIWPLRWQYKAVERFAQELATQPE